jgi:hypothetical protein
MPVQLAIPGFPDEQLTLEKLVPAETEPTAAEVDAPRGIPRPVDSVSDRLASLVEPPVAGVADRADAVVVVEAGIAWELVADVMARRRRRTPTLLARREVAEPPVAHPSPACVVTSCTGTPGRAPAIPVPTVDLMLKATTGLIENAAAKRLAA